MIYNIVKFMMMTFKMIIITMQLIEVMMAKSSAGYRDTIKFQYTKSHINTIPIFLVFLIQFDIDTLAFSPIDSNRINIVNHFRSS